MALCETNTPTICQYLLAVYLRTVPHFPKCNVHLPECQFCHLGSGNEILHVHRSPQLYLHAVSLFPALGQCLAELCGAVVQHIWNMAACLNQKELVLWCALAPASAIASFWTCQIESTVSIFYLVSTGAYTESVTAQLCAYSMLSTGAAYHSDY